MQNMYIEDALGNSLKIHDINDTSPLFFLETPIAGLEYPTLRVGEFTNAGADSVDIASIFTGERRVTLTGYVINATSAANLVTLRRQLVSALSPKRDINNVLVQKWLRFTAMDGVQYRLLGQIIDGKMPIDNITNAHFAIDFLANYGVIEAWAPTSQSMNPVVLGSFVLPAILPITFSQDTSSTYALTNNGDQPAYPTITLNGPLTNPRINNLSTGSIMALTLTIPAGQSVVVDMYRKTIVQGGVTNQMQYKTSDSTFWPLQSGLNTLQLTTGSSSDSGTAVVAWRDAYLGV